MKGGSSPLKSVRLCQISLSAPFCRCLLSGITVRTPRLTHLTVSPSVFRRSISQCVRCVGFLWNVPLWFSISGLGLSRGSWGDGKHEVAFPPVLHFPTPLALPPIICSLQRFPENHGYHGYVISTDALPVGLVCSGRIAEKTISSRCPRFSRRCWRNHRSDGFGASVDCSGVGHHWFLGRWPCRR